MKPNIALLLSGLFLFGLSACDADSHITGNPPITGLAIVEKIEILFLESFPVQVRVAVTGVLGDMCTTLDRITQQREGNVFKIAITTTRPADEICAAMAVGFQKVIALDVYGLPAGTYTVEVNGVRGTFTLELDNIIRHVAQ